MINQDFQNAEINLGSTFKDVLPALQGLWTDTEKNGWNLIKLGSKIGFAIQSVDKGQRYMLPTKLNSELTAVIFIGDNEINGSLIKLGDESVEALVSGVAIIIIK